MILRGVWGAGWWCPGIAAQVTDRGRTTQLPESRPLHAAFTVSWPKKKSQNGLQSLYSCNMSALFKECQNIFSSQKNSFQLLPSNACMLACGALCQLEETGQLAMVTVEGGLESRARLSLSVSRAQLDPKGGCALCFYCRFQDINPIFHIWQFLKL